MNRRELSKSEVRLGIIPAVVLVGIITGCLVVAFYLGHTSGRTVGYDRALSEKLVSSVKMPIDEKVVNQKVSDELTSQIYAQLKSSEAKPVAPHREDVENHTLPSLGAIPTTDTKPVVLENRDEKALKEKKTTVVERDVNEEDIQQPPKTLGEESRALVTLGDEPKTAEEGSKVAHAPTIRVLGSDRSLESETKDTKPNEKVASKSEEAQLGATTSEDEVQDTIQGGAKGAPHASGGGAIISSGTIGAKLREPAVQKKGEGEGKSAKQEHAKLANTTSGNMPAGWFAQVAAPRDKADAQKIARELKQSGFATQIEVANVRGEEYYRVLVGPEASRPLAERLVTQLRREPHIKGEPFIKLVK